MLRFWKVKFKIIKEEGENMDIKLFAGKKSNINRTKADISVLSLCSHI
jgi:hypothetical protein